MQSIWNRLWPPEAQALASNPRAIPMDRGPYPNICQNCGGTGSMLVYVIDSGPYLSPGDKSKWLDLKPDQNMPERPSRSGWYNGELKWFNCPVCRDGRLEAWLVKNCGLDGADLHVSMSDYRPMPGKTEALACARSLLAQNANPAGFVTFYGAFGTGKSHLLKSIVNGFCQIRVQARYAVLSDLLADIRERFSDAQGNIAVEAAIEQYRQIPVLCIDEVADPSRANLTGWTQETIFRLLDSRYNRRSELLTVLATNVKPDHMAPQWGYLSSRMDGGQVIEVAGDDMRQFQGQRNTANKPVSQPQEESVERYQTYDTSEAISKFTQSHEMPY